MSTENPPASTDLAIVLNALWLAIGIGESCADIRDEELVVWEYVKRVRAAADAGDLAPIRAEIAEDEAVDKIRQRVLRLAVEADRGEPNPGE